MKNCSVVDVFCGVGGLTHGFVLEDFHVVAGIDSDTSCKFAYEHNNNGAKFIGEKIEDVTPERVRALYPDGSTKILVGCAPCQPFSNYSKTGTKDDKWKLLGNFADLIQAVDPDIVSMENVPLLEKFDGGKVFKDFVSRLKLSYSVTWGTLYCPNYGIPQRRSRLVLFASKRGDVEFVPETHSVMKHPTVASAIEHLPVIPAGGVDETDPLHRASTLSDLNLRRIRQSVPGGSWREWDDDLIAACHRKKTGASYPSVYGRMAWNEPAPTITTQCYGFGNGRFGHPKQDRALSLREAALLQSFPSTYQFVKPGESYHIKTLGRHIGNAVPVGLGQMIARSIKNHLEQFNVL